LAHKLFRHMCNATYEGWFEPVCVTKTVGSDSYRIEMSLCIITFNLQIHLLATLHMKGANRESVMWGWQSFLFVCLSGVKSSGQDIKGGQSNIFDYHSNKWPSVPADVCQTEKFYFPFGSFAYKSCKNEATDFSRSFLCTRTSEPAELSWQLNLTIISKIFFCETRLTDT
jgi:hypothetical protein